MMTTMRMNIFISLLFAVLALARGSAIVYESKREPLSNVQQVKIENLNNVHEERSEALGTTGEEESKPLNKVNEERSQPLYVYKERSETLLKVLVSTFKWS